MAFFSLAIDVFLFSVLIVITINVFYKILVNQNEVKGTKDRIKELNAKAKELRKSGDSQQVEVMFKEIMRENSRLMRMSFKPMIISFIIILVALPWIGTMYGEKSVEIKDGKGEFSFDGNTYAVARNGDSVTINGATCELPCRAQSGEYVFAAAAQGNNVKASPVIALLPFSAPLVGSELGWLGWYFLSSVLLMVVSRRFMKIHV